MPRPYGERVDEEYVEAVLGMVERVPRGRATTYGALAEAVGVDLRRGGPRQVARVMATYGGAVPWWRVVRADGSLPADLAARAREAYAEEATPVHRDSGRVDLGAAFWHPAG